MLTLISWSKDRACQLDLTLSSLKKYFKDWRNVEICVIYTFSNEEYKKGYDIVRSYHPEITWIQERDFRIDTLKAIHNSKYDTISFFVDDDVFVDEFSLNDKEFINFFSDPTITCLSLRMAPYINFCYTQNQPQPQPHFITDTPVTTWNWKNSIHDWGYPFSVAALHIFRKVQLIPLFNLWFRAPNSFEGALCSLTFNDTTLMTCYKHAKCITSTNNRVQTENSNKHDNLNSLEDLNINFINGKRLSTDVNNNYKLNMAHGPLQYSWR